MKNMLNGTYAAVLTPRRQTGELDEARFRAWLAFLIERGISGFVVNGATGEFCRTIASEFDRLVAITAEMACSHAGFLACIGGATSHNAIEMGRTALRRGADALLLPMPYFFSYSQSDLSAFCHAVASAVDAPILLYNLPQFASPLEPETSLRLICECKSIVGIKDSSGSLDTMELLTRENIDACRIIGNDQVLSQALEAGLCDGVVSGVACVFPELLLALYACAGQAHGTHFRRLAEVLQSLLHEIDILPVPWSLKVLAECVGLATATFPFPLSPERRRQKSNLEAWFQEHKGELQPKYPAPAMDPTRGR
ncbi:MAG: dihydrodipicolinate synthase family protein [Terracidiphilus sp.]